jgi:hypothetical protein
MFILPRNPEPERTPPVVHSLWKPLLCPGTPATAS